MFGEHAAFIVPSYIITAIALIGMTLVVLKTYKSRKLELKSLEEAGVSRRAGKTSDD